MKIGLCRIQNARVKFDQTKHKVSLSLSLGLRNLRKTALSSRERKHMLLTRQFSKVDFNPAIDGENFIFTFKDTKVIYSDTVIYLSSEEDITKKYM